VNLNTLLSWWNLVFALPLVLGLLLGLLVVSTGLAGGDGHGGDHPTGDGHADGHSHDSHVEGQADSPIFRLLNFFGIGQGVPLLVLLPILFVIWGVLGLFVNQVLPVPQLFALSLVVSLLGTAYAGQGLSKLMARIFKDNAQAVSSHTFVGLIGKVIYTVTSTGGVVHIRDKSGNIHRLVVRSLDNETIQPNEEILVVDFDEQARVYEVMPYAKVLEAKK
jgi:membrane protein implicated in regulation of membrane protease activity